MEPSILMNLTRGRIVHLLLTDGPATVREISTALTLNEATVKRALDRLSDAGFVCASDPVSAHDQPVYVVDAPHVADEMAHVRHIFDPWL